MMRIRTSIRTITREGRLLVPALAALAGLACAPASAPPAAAEPADPPPAAARPAEAARGQPVDVCMLEGGALTTVRAELSPATGDTLVAGRPFREVFPDTGQYAAGHAWYRNNEPIDYDPQNVCYVRYGLPRRVPADSLSRLGSWQGVAVFGERNRRHGVPDLLYVAVAPGCIFAAYQYMTSAPPVACPQPERFVTP